MSAVRHHNARSAALTRWHPDDAQAIEAAKREAKFYALAEHVERAIADAPPLTATQRERIAALLRPTAEVANG